MPTISSSDGWVAVTGASGYIGSWVVKDLVDHGYRVKACVRDKTRPDKVDHLLAMSAIGPGSVELFDADLWETGSYDAAFTDCVGIVHTAAPLGYNGETPQQTYDGCFASTRDVAESALKAGTVKRFVYTSSFAAVSHPCEDGYIFTEEDWAGQNIDGYNGAWTEENISTRRNIAYAMAKTRSERCLYDTAREYGTFEVQSILPGYVIGPVMCANHDQNESFQYWLKRMMLGDQYGKVRGGRMQWNNVDVRDIGTAHRLCLERSEAGNGSRYIIASHDDSTILFTWEMQELMQELFPKLESIGGEEMAGEKPAQPTPNRQRAYTTKAEIELGLTLGSLTKTLLDTAQSYFRLGLIPEYR